MTPADLAAAPITPTLTAAVDRVRRMLEIS